MSKVTNEQRREAGERLDCLGENGEALLRLWESPPDDLRNWAVNMRDSIEQIRATLDKVEAVVKDDLYRNVLWEQSPERSYSASAPVDDRCPDCGYIGDHTDICKNS